MTPERIAEVVARWARFYTRDLPAPVAQRRIGEIDADLHDHIVHERAHGTEDRRIALGLAARMLRGLAADAAWRSHVKAQSNPEDAVSKAAYRSVIRVALVTTLVLLVPFLSMLVSDGASWSLADFILAAVLLAGSGALLELAVRKPRSIALRVAAVAIGIAAMVFGNADDAPGLVLFGLLLIAGTVALSIRTAQRSE
jgi:hypothetical protein